MLRPAAPALALILALAAPAAAQDLRGHGGPVRALAVGEDGLVYSGSFDTRAILWDGATAARITRHHTGAVTAILPLPEGRFATGGQDGVVAIWGDGLVTLHSEELHPMPVAALAAWEGGLASGGWDGRIALWSGAEPPRFIDAHEGQITGLVAFEGGLASTGADLSLRLWDASGAPGARIGLAAPVSSLATDGRAFFLASPDGTLRRIAPDGSGPEAALSDRPLLSVAAAEGLLAAGDMTGTLRIIAPETLEVLAEIETGQGPLWTLAITPEAILSGGNDGLIRRWSHAGAPLGTGPAAPETTLVSPRGAEVFRACAVCHTLTPDDGARAGPTLHGIFGRRIATAPGYDYSPALREMDIVWTPETVSELFEFGPEAYTPGSRMPEQRIPSAEDRAELMKFLQTATR
ncbi:c-type cytochrome [Roseovarius aquimarinus]|uniref:C-type cytochrome n=1 Tax=Roseovarius aquimarinus TaxID=1229156 RepID=A0ABW7I8P5_9RHOB